MERPRPQAFKQPGLSVWHKNWLDQRSIPLEKLRVGSLEGAGQAHHAVEDYHRFAEKLSLPIKINPNPVDVPPQLEEWKEAHHEVFPRDIPSGGGVLPLEFRNLLILNARLLVTPDEYA